VRGAHVRDFCQHGAITAGTRVCYLIKRKKFRRAELRSGDAPGRGGRGNGQRGEKECGHGDSEKGAVEDGVGAEDIVEGSGFAISELDTCGPPSGWRRAGRSWRMDEEAVMSATFKLPSSAANALATSSSSRSSELESHCVNSIIRLTSAYSRPAVPNYRVHLFALPTSTRSAQRSRRHFGQHVSCSQVLGAV
jgi:hypothetical protein